MPPLAGQARRNFLSYVMGVIHSRGYVYNPGHRGDAAAIGGNMNIPALGSQMNCEGAVLLMKDMALHLSAVGNFASVHLRIVRTQVNNRMLFPWVVNMARALGNVHPAYVTNIGWVFDNHYRLRDAGDGNRLYDPTFGTVSPNNYDAIAGSVATMVGPGMTTSEIFGQKHLVVTQGMLRAKFDLHQNPVPVQYAVDDTCYV